MRIANALLGAVSILAVLPATAAAQGQVFNLGEIVVTAPRAPVSVAVDSTTLSAPAIQAYNRLSLDDAANLMPGVYASNTGGSRNERVISVRGFNRFEVPLSIDGIRVFLPADNRWTVNSAGKLYYQTGAYALLNMTAEYALSDQLAVQVGARNLLDRNYQFVDGFPEPGHSIFMSFKARY